MKRGFVSFVEVLFENYEAVKTTLKFSKKSLINDIIFFHFSTRLRFSYFMAEVDAVQIQQFNEIHIRIENERS
jgi:hypothetical protein